MKPIQINPVVLLFFLIWFIFTLGFIVSIEATKLRRIEMESKACYVLGKRAVLIDDVVECRD